MGKACIQAASWCCRACKKEKMREKNFWLADLSSPLSLESQVATHTWDGEKERRQKRKINSGVTKRVTKSRKVLSRAPKEKWCRIFCYLSRLSSVIYKNSFSTLKLGHFQRCLSIKTRFCREMLSSSFQSALHCCDSICAVEEVLCSARG